MKTHKVEHNGALYHSHSHHILHVEVLQWSCVGVVTFIRLQDDLLDDSVEEEPILHRVPTALICTERSHSLYNTCTIIIIILMMMRMMMMTKVVAHRACVGSAAGWR